MNAFQPEAPQCIDLAGLIGPSPLKETMTSSRLSGPDWFSASCRLGPKTTLANAGVAARRQRGECGELRAKAAGG